MTWGKMDDKFHRNRKVRELRRMKGGREALGDWAFWWSWCLDDPELTGIVPEFELDASERRSAALLVQVGLWDVVEGGYRFHDFHEYNPRREQLEAKRAADRERIAGKRAASRTDVARDTFASRANIGDESQERPARVAATRDPVPSQPDPSQPIGEARTVGHGDVVELFSRLRSEAHQAKHDRPGGRYVRGPRDWQPVEDLVAFASQHPDPRSALEDSLRGFLADEWAVGAGWPISAWAKDPGKYMGRTGAAPRQGALAVAEAAVAVAKDAYEASYGTERRDECRRALDAARTRLARLRISLEAAS